MRTLPDNPSLEYLRREAKDVLAALRESGTDASLADAQRSVAEQYGFRTWPDLKAEVDRRRSRVKPGDPTLAREIAAVFGLGEINAAMIPIANESMGRSFTLHTDRGRWVAWPVYDWVDDAQAEVGAQLLEAARAAGVSAPRPVRSPGGRLVERIADRNWRAEEAVDAGPSPAQPVRSAVAGKVGETLGTLHALAIPSTQAMNPFLTFRRSREDWETLLARAEAAGADWAPVYASTLPAILELLALEPEPAPSATILCHSNLIPDNVRLAQGDDIVVVGWDFAGSHVAEWELGGVLLQWATGPADRINASTMRALVDGYRSHAASLPKVDLSTFSVAISGWLNWAYTNICSAIEGDDPDTHQFALLETRDILAQPLSIGRLEVFVQQLRRTAV